MPLALLAAAALAPLPCDAAFTARPIAFDATRLRPGRFTYDMTFRGKPIGQFVISIRRQPNGDWRFVADGVGFSQHWEAIATRTMQPRRATLAMPRRGGAYTMTVTYDGAAVAGQERDVPQAGGAPGGAPGAPVDRATHARLTRQTIDQRIDWAAMMAANVKPGRRIGFDVYDPATGSSRVTAFAEPGPAIDGPTGRHPTTRLHYRICKPNATAEPEDYIVHTTRTAPHLMLREDMRGELVSVLVKMNRL